MVGFLEAFNGCTKAVFCEFFLINENLLCHASLRAWAKMKLKRYWLLRIQDMMFWKNISASAAGWKTQWFNTLRPRQNGRHFADDIFKHIFSNENIHILVKILLKFVPMGQIDNKPSLVQIMAWRRPGVKPLSGPMMVSFTDSYLYMHHSVSMS